MKPLDVVIRIDQMRDYRMIDMVVMSQLTSAQHELIKMVRRSASDGKEPSLADLEQLMWKYAAAYRGIDFAEKILLACDIQTGNKPFEGDGMSAVILPFRRLSPQSAR